MKRLFQLLLCLSLMITSLPFFSEDAKGAFEEQSIWIEEYCPFDADEAPTFLISDGTYLIVGTTDPVLPYNADLYRWDGSECVQWQTSNEYYWFSGAIYNGTVFLGTYSSTVFEGNLYSYNIATDTFAVILDTVWWNSAIAPRAGGWLQSIYVHDDILYISGSIMAIVAPWNNNCFMKKCHNTGCANAADWLWVDTNQASIGEIDDLISMVTYDDELFVGSYDPASILHYTDTNQTLWYDGGLNEPYALAQGEYPDGVDTTVAGQGFYGLSVWDDCLHAFSFLNGLNWTRCGAIGINWEYGNLTQNQNLVRSYIFANKTYHGARDNADRMLVQTFDNSSTWSFVPVKEVHQSTDFVQFFEEFESELWMTDEAFLYRRSEDKPKIRITAPKLNEVIYGMYRFTAKVETDRTVESVQFRLADFDDWFDGVKHRDYNLYYYQYFFSERYPDGTYYLEAHLNHSDGTRSRHNISFAIDNTRNTESRYDDDGILKDVYNLPWIPSQGYLNGPDYMEGLEVLDPYWVMTYTYIEVGTPATAHTSFAPYDQSESNVDVLEDIIWISGVNNTLRIWINDTMGTTDLTDDVELLNATDQTSFNLAGQNITLECDTTTISFIRRARVRIVNSFLWYERTDGSYGASIRFYNNNTNDFKEVVMFIGAAEKGDLILPIDPLKASVYDNTNGLSLDLGKEFTVTQGGFWLAISTLSAATYRTFIFTYFQDKDVIATQLILSPYSCDTSGSPYKDRPIRCLVNHDQPSDADFSGTVIFELSEVSTFGTINWNKVTIRTQTDHQLYLKGTHWYVSGAYQITMPNQEFTAGTGVTFEIFIGTVERNPQGIIDLWASLGWVIGLITMIICIFFSVSGLNEERPKVRKQAFSIAGLLFMLSMLMFYAWWATAFA